MHIRSTSAAIRAINFLQQKPVDLDSCRIRTVEHRGTTTVVAALTPRGRVWVPQIRLPFPGDGWLVGQNVHPMNRGLRRESPTLLRVEALQSLHSLCLISREDVAEHRDLLKAIDCWKDLSSTIFECEVRAKQFGLQPPKGFIATLKRQQQKLPGAHA